MHQIPHNVRLLSILDGPASTGESRKRFFEQLHDRVAAIPGVSSATVASDIPLMAMSYDAPATQQFAVDGRVPAPGEPPSLVNTRLRGRRVLRNAETPHVAWTRLSAERRPRRSGRPDCQSAVGVDVFWQWRGDQAPNPADPRECRKCDRAVADQRRRVAHRATVRWREGAGPHRVRAGSRRDDDAPVRLCQLAMSRPSPRLWGALFGFMAFAALVVASIGLYAATAHGVEAWTQKIGLA